MAYRQLPSNELHREQAIAILHSTYALHYKTPPPIIADLLPENDKKLMQVPRKQCLWSQALGSITRDLDI